MPTTPASPGLRWPGPRSAASRQAVGGQHVEQFVAVVEAPRRIDHLQPVGIAVQRDAVVGAVLGDGAHQRLGVRGADAVVDVQPVRRAADGDHVGAQLVEHLGRDLVGRAVGGVHHDLQAAQAEVVVEAALAELDVAAGRVVQPARAAQRGRVGPLRRLGQRGLDLQLPRRRAAWYRGR